MDEVTFTFDWYESFLLRVESEGFDFGRYSHETSPGTALLRHDVDLSPQHALRMAEIEHDLGIRATYFFLLTSPMYNVLHQDMREILEVIQELGHDIGLHFSTHQYWPPTRIPEDSIVAERVSEEADILSTVVDPIETVSFHIPPERVLRREFSEFPSTYEPQFFSEIGHYADSNQRWRDGVPPVERFPERIQILTHPGLWGTEDRPFDERVRRAIDEMGRRTAEYAIGRYIEQTVG